MPRGTTNSSPGKRTTSRSLRCPLRTRKKASVSSWLCQTHAPRAFTTITSYAFNRATVRGEKYSEKSASFESEVNAVVHCFLFSAHANTTPRPFKRVAPPFIQNKSIFCRAYGAKTRFRNGHNIRLQVRRNPSLPMADGQLMLHIERIPSTVSSERGVPPPPECLQSVRLQAASTVCLRSFPSPGTQARSALPLLWSQNYTQGTSSRRRAVALWRDGPLTRQ